LSGFSIFHQEGIPMFLLFNPVNLTKGLNLFHVCCYFKSKRITNNISTKTNVVVVLLNSPNMVSVVTEDPGEADLPKLGQLAGPKRGWALVPEPP
jgi:hypothetical protein